MPSYFRLQIIAASSAVAMCSPTLAADVVRVVPTLPTAAQALLFNSTFDIALGWRSVRSDDDPDNNEHLTFAGEAHVNVPLRNPSHSFQFDLQGEGHNDPFEEAQHGALMAGAHLSWRNPSRHLLGAFFGIGIPAADSIADDDPDAYSGLGYVAGLEGQLYHDRWTFYGQAGWGDFRVDDDSGPEGFVNGWFARGVVRMFVHQDAMIQAEYAYGTTRCFIDGSCAPSEDAGFFHNWGLKGLFRMHHTNLPIYASLEYRGGQYYADEDDDRGTNHALLIGLSFRPGTVSLLQNDRYGATLDTPMLPVRAASWVPGLD